MDDAVAQELDRVEVAAIQASQSQSQSQSQAMPLSHGAIVLPPTTPARTTRNEGNSLPNTSAPANSRTVTAFSSSLRAGVDLIDLEDD